MRRLAIAVIGAILVLASAPTALAGPSTGAESGEIVFRVTLSGPVPGDHTFSLRRECVEYTCVVDPVAVLCAPSDDPVADPPCAPGTYEVTLEAEVGTTVRYALLRMPTFPVGEPSDQPEVHLPGSLVVTAGTQVISLGYVYPSPGGSPALPNTAMTPP